MNRGRVGLRDKEGVSELHGIKSCLGRVLRQSFTYR